MPDLKSLAVQGVRWNTLSSVVVFALGAMQAIVVARALDPHALGLMAIVSIVTGLAWQVAQVGISEAIVQRREISDKQMSSLYWFNVLAGIAAFLALRLVTPWLASLFKMPELRVLLPVSSLSLLAGAVSVQFQSLARRGLRFSFVAVVDVSRSVIASSVVIVSVVLFQQGVWSLVWGLLAGSVIQAAMYVWFGMKSNSLPSFSFRPKEISEIAIFGLYRLGAMLLNYLNSQVDQLTIGALLGPEQLGYYNLVSNMTTKPVAVINPAITSVAFPVFSRIQDDVVMLKKGLLKMLKILSWINAPLLIGFSVMAPVAVPYLFGKQWLPAIPLAQILPLCALLRSYANASGSLLWAKGLASWSFYFNLSVLLICPPVIYVAAMGGSTVCVAWALLLLQAVLAGYLYWAIYRRILGPFWKELVPVLGTPVLYSAIMGGFAGLSTILLADRPLYARFFFGIVVGGIVYGTAILMFQREFGREMATMVWPNDE